MRVLVVGATGTTGSEVIRRLRDPDHPVVSATPAMAVRAMTRSAEAAQRLRAAGLEVVLADLGDPASLAAALEGVNAVYVATSASPQLPDLEGTLATAAAAAGVEHLVKLSVIGASAQSPLTFARLHHASEERIRASGLGWTMVRPNGFMQNTLGWAQQIPSGVIHTPVPDARWSIVDVRDVADVAVAALLDPAAHAGLAYEVTGPDGSSPREQAAVLAELLGVSLDVREVAIAEAVEAMKSQGWPAWSAERMGELLEFYATGAAAAPAAGVQEATGRPPRTYRDFATDHRRSFAP